MSQQQNQGTVRHLTRVRTRSCGVKQTRIPRSEVDCVAVAIKQDVVGVDAVDGSHYDEVRFGTPRGFPLPTIPRGGLQ
jgi:hypothetical protein